MKLIRLPIDLFWLTIHYLKGLLWLIDGSFKTMVEMPRANTFPFKCFSQKTASGQNACLPGSQYGNHHIFKQLCSDCKRSSSGLPNDSYCQMNMLTTYNQWRPGTLRMMALGLLLMSYWGLIGAGSYLTLKFGLPGDVKKEIRMRLKQTTAIFKTQAESSSPLESTPMKAAKFFAQADKLYAAGNFQEALLEYRNALKLDPQNSLHTLGMAECLNQLNRLTEAHDYFEKTVLLDPLQPQANLQLGKNYYSIGDHDKAQKHAEKVIQFDPQNIEAHLLRAASFIRTGDLNAAREQAAVIIRLPLISAPHCQSTAQLFEQLQDNQNVEKYYRQALQLDADYFQAHVGLADWYASNRQFESALVELNAVLSKDPKNLSARASRAELYGMQGETTQSLTTYRELAREFPNNHMLKIRLADLSIESGDINAGFDLLQHVLTDAPDHDKANLIIAKLYLQQKLYSLAAEHARKIWQPHQRHLPAAILLAKACLGQNQPAEALAVIDKIEIYYPQQLELTLLAALAYQKSGDRDRAFTRMNHAASLAPANPTPLFAIAQYCDQLRDYPGAIAAYEKLREISPRDPIIKNNLAMILLTEGNQIDRAYALAQELRNQYPLNPHFADTFGWACYHKHDYQQAKKNIEIALVGLAEEATVIYHYGRVLYALDQMEEGKRFITRALSLKQEFVGSDEAKKIISEPVHAP